MRRELRTLTILIALGGAGCQPTTSVPTGADPGPDALVEGVPLPPHDPAPPFQTDSLSYVLRAVELGWEVEIPITFTNPRAEPVYFVNCNDQTGVRLQEWVDGDWLDAWAPILPACLSPPIVVPARGRWSFTYSIFGAPPDRNRGPAFRAVPRTAIYRLVWTSAVRTYDENAYPFGEPLPLEQRSSNRFRLVVETKEGAGS